MKNIVLTALFLSLLSLGSLGQDLSQIPAKYEGGMFGFYKKMDGALRFDDANSRLVFIGDDNKEKFSVPYSSITVAAPTSKSVRSVGATTAGVVAGAVVPGGGLLGMIREKRRYLSIEFDDPEVTARGAVSFKVGGSSEISAAISRIGEKAGLVRRGDAYYRPRPVKTPN